LLHFKSDVAVVMLDVVYSMRTSGSLGGYRFQIISTKVFTQPSQNWCASTDTMLWKWGCLDVVVTLG